MAANNIDLTIYVNRIKAEADLLLSTVREKGVRRFGTPLAISGGMIALAYFGVYVPPQSKIARLAREIAAARAMSEAGTQYQDLRNQLAGSYGNLPLLKDQQQWLSNAMIDSLRADNLTPESFRPVVEAEASGLLFQTATVQLTLRFKDLYSWLQRLEGAKPLMHVAVVELSKLPMPLGWNSVSCSVMTAIPKKRFN